MEQDPSGRCRADGAEWLVLMGFNGDRGIAKVLCFSLDFIEQHGFTDTPQACEQQAFLGAFLANSPEQDASLLQNWITAN